MDFVCRDNFSKTSVVWILSVEARFSQAEQQQQRQIDLDRHDNFSKTYVVWILSVEARLSQAEQQR